MGAKYFYFLGIKIRLCNELELIQQVGESKYCKFVNYKLSMYFDPGIPSNLSLCLFSVPEC